MDVSWLLERTAQTVWRRRMLLVMGALLTVLTSSGLFEHAFGGALLEFVRRIPGFEVMARLPELSPGLVSLEQVGQAFGAINTLGTGGWIGFGAACLTVLIGAGVAAMVVFGGMIAAGAERDDEVRRGFGAAIGAGWRRAWPMIIIVSIPAIPATLGAIVIIGAATLAISAAGGIGVLSNGSAVGVTIVLVLALLTLAVMIPVLVATVGLRLVSELAYRACMLDGTGAIDSFRLGWRRFTDHIGEAAILAALTVGLDVVAGLVVSLPDNLSYVFLPAILIMWSVEGVVQAYTTEMWTLAWQEWAKTEG